MIISYRVDDRRQRVTVALEGAVTGDAFNRTINPLFEAHPQFVEYDFIYDLSTYTGDVSHESLAVHSAVYNRCLATRTAPCDRVIHTVIATRDRSFGYWVEVMRCQFPNRLFKLVPTAPEADAFLAEFHGKAA
jgi:hypothetical protein